ncbi:Ligand-binding SRPBCC domain-containing protein [Geobacter sp. DSM 9736]|nr:Ligand-binding SRPBCC domain-containing protein [Geobacter sp. DSM 9736]
MKVYRLERVQLLRTTVEEAWRFFSDPANLPLITPPSLGFRVTSPLPGRMYPGMLVTYTVTPFPPLRVVWVTEITHVSEPHYFVDEQRFGPYRLWHHEHHFRQAESGVEMADTVTYALGFGLAGRMAAPFVAARLRQIFDFRHGVLSQMW